MSFILITGKIMAHMLTMPQDPHANQANMFEFTMGLNCSDVSQVIHPGILAEALYAKGMHSDFVKLISKSQPAFDYVTGMTAKDCMTYGVNVAEMHELTRVSSTKDVAIHIMEEIYSSMHNAANDAFRTTRPHIRTI